MTAWQSLNRFSQGYLLAVDAVGLLTAISCFALQGGIFSRHWLLLTIAAAAVATISVKLPQTSAVISMGDVLTILAVMNFGAGPALATFWVQMLVGGATETYRRGRPHQIAYFKVLYNSAQCAIAIWAMTLTHRWVLLLGLETPTELLVSVVAITSVYFALNTIGLYILIVHVQQKSLRSIWSNAFGIYVLNFAGSGAAAGLISLVYDQHSVALFLSLPIAAVVYQLYRFYIDKYQSAQKHISELNDLYLQTVEALATAVDAKDRYTFGHTRRVQSYAVKLAELIGITDENDLMAMRSGSMLHDIGKIAVPEYILNKPTVLTATEFQKMKIHPSVGAEMLRGIDFPFPVAPLVRSHHERWDGRGYPDGLKGTAIPLSARILSLVDCYDALTTDRPYRSPMSRTEVIEFFKRESGKAYDPEVVEIFLSHLPELEAVGAAVEPPDRDIWGIERASAKQTENVRRFEDLQPVQAYGSAMNASPSIQRELHSVFEFVRTSHTMGRQDIIEFMGIKLTRLLEFDAAAFYIANSSRSVVVNRHSVGAMSYQIPVATEIPLEQKLSGWVAANNQALCNLPPFPDFLRLPEPKPGFKISAIAPMNFRGIVIGAISLYRSDECRFTDQEFRRLEMLARQSAAALHDVDEDQAEAVLFDELTGLPNGYQIYLMFDQVVMDASRYDYPVSILSFELDDFRELRSSYGSHVVAAAIREIAQQLKGQLCETDILVRHSEHQFLTLHSRLSREEAEGLKSKIQDHLDRSAVTLSEGSTLPLRVSIGVAEFPLDGSELEDLLSVAEWRLGRDLIVRRKATAGESPGTIIRPKPSVIL